MSGFDLKFLGTGNGFCKSLTNTCAYYKENDKILIIDCGETVISKIIDNKLFNNVKDVYFVFTHTHSDHIGSLGSTIFYLYFIKKIRVNIVINDELLYKDDIITLLKIFGTTTEMFSIVNSSQIILSFNSVNKFEFLKNRHVSEVVSYAIKIIDNKNKSYYYTGDSCDYDLLKSIVKDKSLARAYVDCSVCEREKTHLQISKIIEIVPSSIRNKIYCMHFLSKEAIIVSIRNGFKVTTKRLNI